MADLIINLPSFTSSWEGEMIVNHINVEASFECTPNEMFTAGLVDFLKGDKVHVKNDMSKHFPPYKTDDLYLSIQKECFDFAFNNFVYINSECLEDIE